MGITRSILICVCTIAWIAGCTREHSRPTSISELGRDNVVALSQNNAPPPDAPKDAQSAVPIVFRLQAYQLCVPVGTISRNETFWKRIDEHCLDVPAEDNLLRNGMRVGVAPLSQWEYLNNLIQQNPGT